MNKKTNKSAQDADNKIQKREGNKMGYKHTVAITVGKDLDEKGENKQHSKNNSGLSMYSTNKQSENSVARITKTNESYAII